MEKIGCSDVLNCPSLLIFASLDIFLLSSKLLEFINYYIYTFILRF